MQTGRNATTIRVSGIVTRWIRFGDYRKANFARVSDLIRQAAAAGAQITCTTECFLDGYHLEVSDQRYAEVGEYLETMRTSVYGARLKALAAELGIYIAAGVAVADPEHGDENGDPQPFNSCQLYSPQGDLVGMYYKTHNHMRRSPWFEQMSDKAGCFPAFETAFGRVGFMICNDRIFAETTRWLKQNGAQYILCPTGGAFAYDMLAQHSSATGLGIAWVHPFGFAATGPDGKVIVEQKFEEGELFLEEDDLGGPLDHREVCLVDLPIRT